MLAVVKTPHPIEATDWWKKMQKNRAGNLLAGARLKKQLTQAESVKILPMPSHVYAKRRPRREIRTYAAISNNFGQNAVPVHHE